jgi:hypothetical protein
LLTALAEGLNKRYLGDPTAAALLVDEQTRRTLLGKGALLLALGGVDTGDGSSVDQIADKLFATADRDAEGRDR